MRFYDWKGTRTTTTITNYTTYDLEYYYADLRRLPRLSREERQHLVTGMSGPQVSPAMPRETQVKHQLIEGYLPFAKHLAITLCPPTLYQRLLPDLIGAVNLAVVEATMRCDLSSTMSLDAYIAAYVRGAIKAKEARARQRQQHLEEACTRLEAQGVRVTSPLLAKEARVMKQTAIDFLKAQRSTSHAAH
jgi:DNA-directed RNA polymerase specialized sigma subunit